MSSSKKKVRIADAPLPGRSIEGSFDLHMHSTFSDGSKHVDQLIAEAREAGLTGIAITDHDSLSQLSAVRQASREADFPVLAGCEVSTLSHKTGRKVHILAYGLEATSDGSGPLEKLVAQTLYKRTSCSLWQAWRLIHTGAEFGGHTLDMDDVLEVGRDSTAIYKQHIMEALTHRDRNDPDYAFVYACLFKNGGPADRTITYPTPKEAVRAIREQGGVPVLAHPQQMDSWDIVPGLVKAGLKGIEAFHPDNDEAAEKRAFKLAHKYGLMVTGGSDYHGKYGAAQSVGTRFVTPEEAGEPLAELYRAEQKLH